jgi:hypothetical protein
LLVFENEKMARKRVKNVKGFTTTQVHEITGISVRKLRWWDKNEIVKPNALAERNKGQRRLYNLQDIICLIVVYALRKQGVSLKKIKESVNRIEVTGIDHPLAKLRVACLAQTLIFKKNDGNYVDPISGQLVIKEALEIIRHKAPWGQMVPAKKEAKSANRQYAKKVVSF